MKFIAQDKSLNDRIVYYRELKELTGEAEPDERLFRKLKEKIPVKGKNNSGKDKPEDKG